VVGHDDQPGGTRAQVIDALLVAAVKHVLVTGSVRGEGWRTEATRLLEVVYACGGHELEQLGLGDADRHGDAS